jgi:ABC-type antimicrobial peptide transport system permease subunit
MALGAGRAAIASLVLRRVVVLVAAGLLAGILASLWAARFVEALVFGVPPRDAGTLAAAAAVLATVATLAGWIPARRAARIDPAAVLRESR